MKKRVIFGVLMMMMMTVGFSQELKSEKRHLISLFHSVRSEKGFSFKYQPDRLGVQVTGLPMFSKSKRVFFGIGVSGLCSIQKTEYMNMYGFMGGQYVESDIFEKTNRFNVMTGLGVKTRSDNGFEVITHGGYGVLNAFETNMKTAFSAEIGIQYKL